MAVNLPSLRALDAVAGVRCATVQAGVRVAGRDDLVLFEIAKGAAVAGVFTRNRFRAAPVQLAEARLAQCRKQAVAPRYLLINTGNANAGTGPQGMADAVACCAAVAHAAGIDADTVLPFSTGVIGEHLAADRIVAAVPQAVAELDEAGWLRAAAGIMTTDTAPKGATGRAGPDGAWQVTGIAKGAGMIRPDMATMLAFIATDAPVAPGILDLMLQRAVDASFNRITVDGDTSTNDAVMLMATGRAGGELIEEAESAAGAMLQQALIDTCRALAQQIVRDGEGATRFVTVEVCGAASSSEALDCAYAVAQSPLVKTALHAGDPNWGRILAAVGRCGIEDLDVDRVAIRLGDVVIVERGGVAASYRESQGERVMAEPEIVIAVDLGRGGVSERVWTTDLSYEYVRINAEYRS